MPGSRSQSPRWAHSPRGVTPGGQHPPQRLPRWPPRRCLGTPACRRGSAPCVRAGPEGIRAAPALLAPRGRKYLLGQGPTRALRTRRVPRALQPGGGAWTRPPPNAGRPLRSQRGPRLHPGRGSKRREGPQASTCVGRSDPAHSPRWDRGQGSAAPLVRPIDVGHQRDGSAPLSYENCYSPFKQVVFTLAGVTDNQLFFIQRQISVE
ncbi:hypothetical protein NDU88_003674 [Pleurodeles waltl]|uniref:Uncharacterized protein n=1 Tax=Pleurodeles waltl TaxID=8319 RepID=A0AAV7V255_PLEWA|nr:hypothetical protein NDU88_003674 [Pleurodeles waltl]